jgi:hypothetical protein
MALILHFPSYLDDDDDDDDNNSAHNKFYLSQVSLLTFHKLLQCRWRIRTSFQMSHANINQNTNRPPYVAHIHYLLICLHN